MPRISVITICFNNLIDVINTCSSVDIQMNKPFEHWIINGSTNEEIAEWLENNPQPIYRKWINERDKGIADAFNKGIANCNGDVIHILNSGDFYTDEDVLALVYNTFELNEKVQWVSGKIKLKRGGEWVEVGKPFSPSKVYRGMRSISHPTWFVKSDVYQRVGGYSSEYKIAMDYDLMCRIAKEPYSFIDKTIAVFDDSGISSNNYLASLKENIRVYELNFGYSIKCRLWQFRLKIIYILLNSYIGKYLYRLKVKYKLENV